MYTLSQYAAQVEELKSRARGFERPVLNTMINLLLGAGKLSLALAELDRLGQADSKTHASFKSHLAAKAMRAERKLDFMTLDML